MKTLSERAFQVAITGEVQQDDPHLIADMMAEIDRLQAENLALRKELELEVNRNMPQVGDADPSHPADLAEIRRLRAALDGCYRAICHIKFDRDKEPALTAAKDRAYAALKTDEALETGLDKSYDEKGAPF